MLYFCSSAQYNLGVIHGPQNPNEAGDTSPACERRSLHVVLATRGSRSYVNPLLAVAAELIARGHRITFATLACYETLVVSYGCRYHPLRPDDPPAATAPLATNMRLKSDSTLRSILFARVEETYRDLRSAAEGADLLAGHHVLLPLEMAATSHGIPWVPVFFTPGMLNSIFDPPVIPMLPRLHHLQRRSRHVCAAFNALFKRYTDAWYQPYRDLRARENFPAETCNYILDGARSPYLNLALFSPLLGSRQPDWNKHIETSGFAFLPETFVPKHTALRRFLENGPAPIVATLGSSGTIHTRHFFENSLAAARRLGRRIVLITGSLSETGLDASDTSFAFPIQHAPYGLVFRHACAVVHSGAIGATAETLRAGKPMLVVPTAAADQPDNAFRAVRLGVARTLSMSAYTPDAATESLRVLLSEARYAQNARNAAQQIQQEHGAARAADWIENTAFTSAHSTRQRTATSRVMATES
jgi:rhamnosyltransferase subunit B